MYLKKKNKCAKKLEYKLFRKKNEQLKNLLHLHNLHS